MKVLQILTFPCRCLVACMFSCAKRSSVSSRERLCMCKQMFPVSRVAEVRPLHLPLISFPLSFPFTSICSSVPCGWHLRPSGGTEESGHLTKCLPLELDSWGKLAGPCIGANTPFRKQREWTKRESRAINTRECNTSTSDSRTDKWRGPSVIAQLDKTFAFVIFTPHVLHVYVHLFSPLISTRKAMRKQHASL